MKPHPDSVNPFTRFVLLLMLLLAAAALVACGGSDAPEVQQTDVAPAATEVVVEDSPVEEAPTAEPTAVPPTETPTEEPTAEPTAGTTSGATLAGNCANVYFPVVDGRVYHRNLEFLIDDVPVRSQGSVGFDETLALEIEVPIQAKWVGNRPGLQSLVGQPIRIPVTGTFVRPTVDERAIGAFLTQAAQAAAGGLLGDELNKAFDKLLKPK